MSGFSMGQFPMKYLGVPIFSGRVKSWYFDDLLFKISKKIEGWKMRYLSAGARLLLIKHVLSSLPVHLLSVLPVPKQTQAVLDPAPNQQIQTLNLTQTMKQKKQMTNV